MIDDADYKKILRDAEEDENILGLLLTGSRGKDCANEYSDYDLILITKDEALEEIRKKYDRKLVDVDMPIYSLSEFKEYAKWGSAEMWDRYDYAHIKILVDKIGNLEELVYEKGYVPKEKQKEYIEFWIDGYINSAYRAIKCVRAGNKFGNHLLAVNSMLDILTLVFAMNGRHRPFPDYVETELEKYPLEILPWKPKDFLQMIRTVLETGDLKTQQTLLSGIEKQSREMGYGHMIDGWDGGVEWAINYQPE